MSRASSLHNRKLPVTLNEPTDDLKLLGEKLQQSLQFTRSRIPDIKNHDLKRQACHTLDRANYMFHTLSQTVQTVDRMQGFLESNFGLSIDEIFALADENEYFARVSTRSAMVMVNQGISSVLTDLAKVNVAIDKENQNDEKKM